MPVGYGAEGRLGLGPARLATRSDAADCDDLVAKVPDLRVLDVDLGENLVLVSDELAEALVSPMHRRFPFQRHQHRRMPLDLGVEFLWQNDGCAYTVEGEVSRDDRADPYRRFVR